MQEAGLEIKDLEISGDYNRKKESIKKYFETCITNFYQNIFLTKFSTIDNSSKLILYKDLKRDLNMENYLLHENFEKRRFITKLRISDHNLLIEKGRHLKIPREKDFVRYAIKLKMNTIFFSFVIKILIWEINIFHLYFKIGPILEKVNKLNIFFVHHIRYK